MRRLRFCSWLISYPDLPRPSVKQSEIWVYEINSWLDLYVSLIPAATSTFSKLFSTRYYALPTELTRRRNSMNNIAWNKLKKTKFSETCINPRSSQCRCAPLQKSRGNHKCTAVQMCSCMCEQNPDPEATCARGILSEQCQVSFPSLLNCFFIT